jgi:hypothetical protein
MRRFDTWPWRIAVLAMGALGTALAVAVALQAPG